MKKLNCDEINDLCSDVVESFLDELNEAAETKLTTGHTLRYADQDREYIWSRGGYAGPASELLYLEAAKLACNLDNAMPADEYKAVLAAAVENLVNPE